MRCLAVAQVWQLQGGSVRFVGDMTESVLSKLKKEGMEVSEPPVLEPDHDFSWIILDGYHFDYKYQCELKEKGFRVIVIDDYSHLNKYEADIIVNQGGNESMYAVDANLLCGSRYALIRRQFWPWRESRRTPQLDTNRVLVTLGGADPDNFTKTVIDALGLVEKEFRCTVIVGGSNPHRASVAAAAERIDVPVDLRLDVENMASLMAEHDLAVSGGGSTCWELAFMGVPNVIIVLADNQRKIADRLEEEGTAVNLGWHEAVEKEEIADQIETLLRNDEQRIRMARKGQELVDGWGANRIVSCMRDRLFLRTVQEADCERLWNWANDPEVRKRSYNPDPIPWGEHKDWFSEKLSDPSCKIFIAEDGGEPLGQARFDVEDNRAVISVVVDADKRGKGYGTALIKQGTERCLQATDVDRVDAYIKRGNYASVRAFEKAGFQCRTETTVKGEPSYRFSKSCRTKNED